MIFLSYPSTHSVEADLLKFAYETMLADIGAKIWIYERDQPKDEQDIAARIKEQVKESKAFIFLVTPTTLDKSATQWMELAYADAFIVPTFILLHHLSYEELNRATGVPPLLRRKHCTSSKQWRDIERDLRKHCSDGQGGAKT